MSLQHLIMMRHAKSSWAGAGLSDHARPLNDRGRRASAAVGGVLRAKKLFPHIIWSSDSVRTRETVEKMMGGGENTAIEFTPSLYHASANKVLYVCTQKGEPSVGPLLLMGHNPGWEDLFYHFTGMARRIPTGACTIYARKDTQKDWLEPDAWRLMELILPRELEG